jgi:hypothetical protein
MAISRVGWRSNSGWGNGAVVTFATTGAAWAVTAGNTVVVWVGADATSGQSVTGVSDSAGNVYGKVGHVRHATDKYRNECWVSAGVVGHAANVVTVTWSAAVDYKGIVAIEYAGCWTAAPLDLWAYGDTGSGGTTTTASFTTRAANELHLLVARWSGIVQTYPAGFSEITGSLYTPVAEAFVAAPFTGTYTVTGSVVVTAMLTAFTPTAISGGGVGGKDNNTLMQGYLVGGSTDLTSDVVKNLATRTGEMTARMKALVIAAGGKN